MSVEQIVEMQRIFFFIFPIAILFSSVMAFWTVKGWKEENPKDIVDGFKFLTEHIWELFFDPQKLLSEPYATRFKKTLVFCLVFLVPFSCWWAYQMYLVFKMA